MKKHFSLFLLVAFMLPCFAMADGLSNVDTLLQHISGWLRAASISVVTIAILVVAYKVMFGGQTLKECYPILIAAILIGGAGEIARLLIGT